MHPIMFGICVGLALLSGGFVSGGIDGLTRPGLLGLGISAALLLFVFLADAIATAIKDNK